jgi:ribonuclease P protein component
MIPKTYRLLITKNQSFKGEKVVFPWVICVAQPAEHAQWAIRVSKKIDHRAVVRNRLRRHCLQWLYQHRQNLSSKAGLVILRKKPSTVEEMRQLTQNINHAFKSV